AAVKGTSLIETAIESLVDKGYAIDFIALSGVPNSVVMEELQKCDFVVDQVFSDTPMAIFAAEAGVLGKPAVVGGYFSEVIADYLARDDIPPVLFVDPDDLESAIERLIVDREYRLKLGESARDFLSTRWSQNVVAERYLSVIRGGVPAEWIVEPGSIAYIYGGGTSKSNLRRVLVSYANAFGVKAFGFQEKPRLEAAIMDFIGRSQSEGPDA
ncbi:MAG: glycosyltransferase, partial [Shewanella algae]